MSETELRIDQHVLSCGREVALLGFIDVAPLGFLDGCFQKTAALMICHMHLRKSASALLQ